MDKNSNQGFFDTEEAAEFLKCGDKDVLYLVREKKIPHSVLPFGKVLFDRERLRDWVLSFEQMSGYRRQEISLEKSHKISFGKEICQRFGSVAKERSKYTNLYLGQQVYAQLHPRLTGDGIDLALRECGDDENLPKCNVLRRIEIRELKGYWKVNKSWLEGNGRFTEHPATAFHIPGSMQDEPENPGWKELKALLDYTSKKLSQK
ncbi:MAG TPA: helix-turn-helix domain-containing protein [Sedimentisphaerales bacterium]|nr:helix-turn-helix domain-containing protein [Sedimentisphaerales bacterium]